MNDRALTRAVASLRVAASVVTAGAAAYAALAAPGVAAAALAGGRVLLLGGAIALAVAARGSARIRRRVPGAGAAVDLASLLLGACRQLIVAGAGAAALATAEVAVAAAVLALATAHLVVRASLERRARSVEEGRRARVQARRDRLARERSRLRDAQDRGELLLQLVVHDLRNPLAVVDAHLRLVHAAIAGMPALAAEVESLEIASGEALRLTRMIGDLLLVPRLERGELQARFSAVRVRDVLDPVVRAMHPQASGKGLRVEVAAPQALVAWIDAELVRRMVENLVSNALRYTPGGGRIELAAQIVGDRLRVAVRNSGAPVPEAVRGRLFEKYATHGPGRQHHGLGLFLCRLVSELHGGTIALVERAGWGVSFEADLPLVARGVRDPATSGAGAARLTNHPWEST